MEEVEEQLTEEFKMEDNHYEQEEDEDEDNQYYESLSELSEDR